LARRRSLSRNNPSPFDESIGSAFSVIGGEINGDLRRYEPMFTSENDDENSSNDVELQQSKSSDDNRREIPAGYDGPVIVCDSREQLPYDFGGRVATMRLGLPTGDYSLLGFETTIAIERKTLGDYVGSLTWQRERFLRECERLGRLPIRAIVVEGSLSDIINQKYPSSATPQSIVGSTIKLITDFGVNVVFCDCRAFAERFTERMLVRHWEHALKAHKGEQRGVS